MLLPNLTECLSIKGKSISFCVSIYILADKMAQRNYIHVKRGNIGNMYENNQLWSFQSLQDYIHCSISFNGDCCITCQQIIILGCWLEFLELLLIITYM